VSLANTEPIAASLEEFIRREGRVEADDPDFSRQVNLFDAGYLDSLGVVHLITHLEVAFGLELSDEALADPAFVSIDGMSAIVGDLHERSNA
jgi:acyl carrier protein